MKRDMKQIFEILTRLPWSAIYTQRGVLEPFNNTSFRGCCAASVLIMTEVPLWVYAVDSGEYKEVEVNLDVSIDDKFGQEKHEALFNPPRLEVKTYPDFCRMDLFLNEKLSAYQQVERSGSHQLVKGVVLVNGRADRLGLFADEGRPGNLLLTTDSKSIERLCV